MRLPIADDIDLNAHTLEVINNAVDELAARAGLWGTNSEPGHQLFILGRLQAELDQRVLDTARRCRQHDYTWNEIAQLLNPSATP